MKWIAVLTLVLSLQAQAALKIVTYNIENYKASFSTNEALLKKSIAKLNPDLLSVQEIVDAKGFSRFLANHFPSYGLVLSHCGGFGEQKLGFVYKKSAIRLVSFREDRRFESFSNGDCGALRPAVVGVFEDKHADEYVTVVGVHLKAGGGSAAMLRRSKQYLQITDLVKSLKKSGQSNVVVTGDFNSTGFVEKNQDYQNFARMLNQVDGISSADHLDCTAYWSGEIYNDNIEEPSILDHVVVTGTLKNRIKSVDVGAHCKKVSCQRVGRSDLGDTYNQVSDHCPVGVAIE